MTDLSSLSDEQLKQLYQSKQNPPTQPTPDLLSMSDDDLKKLYQSKQQSVPAEKPGFIQSRIDYWKQVGTPEFWQGIAKDFQKPWPSKESLLDENGHLKLSGSASPEEKRQIQNLAFSFMPITQGLNAAGQAGRAAMDFLKPANSSGVNPISDWLMRSALKAGIKPSLKGDTDVAVKTLLDKGVNVTPGGVDKLRGMLDDLNNQISSKIEGSPATVDIYKAANRVGDTYQKFANQVSPTSDLNAITGVTEDFLSHPAIGDATNIPVTLAQKMKQGTYKVLNNKYGQLGSAETEAQKAIARGLKEEVANAVPGIGPLNAQESDLLKTLSLTERRALMDANKNPAGLAWLSANPKTWAAFMADRSPLFKSLVARMINSGANIAPAITDKINPNLALGGSAMLSDQERQRRALAQALQEQ